MRDQLQERGTHLKSRSLDIAFVSETKRTVRNQRRTTTATEQRRFHSTTAILRHKYIPHE